MKKIYLTLAFIALASIVRAQRPSFPPLGNNRDNAMTVGIKGGIVIPKFLYSDKALSDMPNDLLLRQAAGLFVELPLKHWSVIPQVMYYGLGTSSTYTYKEDYRVHYCVRSNYLDCRVSVAYKLPLTSDCQIYAYLAPGMGILLHGDLALSQPNLDIAEVTLEMTDANMRETNLFVAGGLGAQYSLDLPVLTLIMKFEVGYNQGLSNSFSKKEVGETALPTNVYAYNNTGTRLTQGIEMLVSFALPMKFGKRDKFECSRFSEYHNRRVALE